MNPTNKLNQKQRVFHLLATGKAYTASQIRSRFHVANPSAVVNNLRNEGAPIYTIKTRTGSFVYQWLDASRRA